MINQGQYQSRNNKHTKTIMRMSHIKPVLSLTLMLAATAMPAQQVRTWTLKQCIDHALEHNIGIKQHENERRRTSTVYSPKQQAAKP